MIKVQNMIAVFDLKNILAMHAQSPNRETTFDVGPHDETHGNRLTLK